MDPPPGATGGDWRSNVLGFSTDTDLSDGVTIDAMVQDSPCHAADVVNPTAYQYWVGGEWVPAAEHLATPLFAGVASELSVRHDDEHDRWQMSYLDPVSGSIVLRHASAPQGEWSAPAVLARTADYPKAYGGFIHPWSSGDDLYFTMSEWDSYNVYLMCARVTG